MIEHVGILGFGNMGEALARGLRERHPSLSLLVLDKQHERRESARAMGATVFAAEDFGRFISSVETVVLSVKPQDLSEISSAAGGAFADCQVISILAGTTIETLQRQLGAAQVARLMPSLAAQVGRAVVGVALPADASAGLRDSAHAIAEAMGSAQELPERLMSAVTGLSGSGLAYVFAFIHALALGGTRAGIPYQQSLQIAREVTAGAAELLSASGEHPISAMSRVASPAGTTIEGINALEHNAFTAAVIEAVGAAVARAAELEQ